MKPLAGLRSRRLASSAASRLEVSTTIGPARVVGEPFGDYEAVDVRQHDVQQHDIGPLSVDRRQRRGSVTDLTNDREPVGLQQATGEPTEPGVVIDDQHRPRHVQIISRRRADLDIGDIPEIQSRANEVGISSMRTERDRTSLVRMVHRHVVRIASVGTRRSAACASRAEIG